MRIKTLVALYFWILEFDDVACIRSIKELKITGDSPAETYASYPTGWMQRITFQIWYLNYRIFTSIDQSLLTSQERVNLIIIKDWLIRPVSVQFRGSRSLDHFVHKARECSRSISKNLATETLTKCNHSVSPRQFLHQFMPSACLPPVIISLP